MNKVILFLIVTIGINACPKPITKETRESAEKRLYLGIEYMKLGHYEMAMDRLKKAIELDQNYADAHNALAVLFERLEQNNKAQIHYQKALAIAPENADIQNNYGQFLCKRGQDAEADKHFLKAINNSLYKTPEIPYTNAGICALRNKQLKKAETYFQKALQANPKFSLALYHLAEISYKQKKSAKARDYLNRYLKDEVHTPETLWLGICVAQALNDSQTETNYKRLLRSSPYQDSKEASLLEQRSGRCQ